jgi:hypothetical protein
VYAFPTDGRKSATLVCKDNLVVMVSVRPSTVALAKRESPHDYEDYQRAHRVPIAREKKRMTLGPWRLG